MLTLKLHETMSGWIELNSDRKQEALAFTIDVVFTHRLKPFRSQPFTGVVRLLDRHYETTAQGFLTLQLSGTRYELEFQHPDLGLVELAGDKQFDITNLKESLVLCPLTVYQDRKAVGYAEVMYRDSLLHFRLDRYDWCGIMRSWVTNRCQLRMSHAHK